MKYEVRTLVKDTTVSDAARDTVFRASQWVVTVNGQTHTVKAPGELYVGRKPLRPVSVPEGAERMDVPDETKSMSKTHALVSVSADGQATLKDAQSTNGTYVQNARGELVRVPAENPYTVFEQSIAGQFGDVQFSLAASPDLSDDTADSQTKLPVVNLFDYKSPAPDDAPAQNMSVDDILDLRAGEPTSMFAMQKPKAEEPVTAETDVFKAQDAEKLTEKTHTETATTSLAPLTEDSGYMPVYEAGSVFDRLSRGEFERHEDIIEAGGHTSEEAKTTRDFNAQFDIAQIPELLPFLGLNPFLYDDMYAWLVAQNNEQINRALETNDGYTTWKASTK
ncbi:hypothetical protein ALMA_0555 [Alloscardovia macacae]|uniref:FHA domain-containing protein n=1 Tax=Alloscardovia macacae TaxID=1160091 RepID=A0A261F4R3_9BIFI|nr:hypothetical protein ALMA_0555 [Alloscardovia macacae]